MTYGEAIIWQKSTMRMQGGQWIAEPLPEFIRLGKEKAIKYYGAKLEKIWQATARKRTTNEILRGILD